MHKLEDIAAGGILLSIAMIAVAAVNDKRLKEPTGEKPFMTKGQQNTLLGLAVVPAAVAFTLIAQKMEAEAVKI